MPNLQVGTSRRITLPKEFLVKDGDSLSYTINNQGQLIFSPVARTENKIKLYAVVVGQGYTGRWFGVIMDRNGNVGARVSSSTHEYLISDMTLMNDKDIVSRLNKKFGINNWERPIFTFQINVVMQEALERLVQGLHDGTWPK